MCSAAIAVGERRSTCDGQRTRERTRNCQLRCIIHRGHRDGCHFCCRAKSRCIAIAGNIDFCALGSAGLIPGEESQIGIGCIIAVGLKPDVVRAPKQQRRSVTDAAHVDPAGTTVNRVLPGAVATGDRCNGDPFGSSRVHIRDTIATSRGDDRCNRLTSVVDVVFGDGRQRHGAGAIQHRCIVDTGHIDGNRIGG